MDVQLSPAPASPTDRTTTVTGLGALALTAAGLLFAAYPLLRPYTDETTTAGAAAFASSAWVTAHLCAMGFLVLLPLGVAALEVPTGARVAAWLGSGLVLPYYGAETWGLHAIGTRAHQDGSTDLLALADPIRFHPAAATTFGVGLVLLAVAGVVVAVSLARAPERPTLAGLPLAVGLVTYLPQFFAAPGLRVAHGLLVAAGCLVLVGVLLGRDPLRRR